MRRFDKLNNIRKANLLSEQRYLETKKMISEGIPSKEFLAKLEDPLDILASGRYPIERISKEVNGGYEILGLSPFELLKGSTIRNISQNIWGIYDKNVKDYEMARLTTSEKDGEHYVFKYRINAD